MTSEEQVRNIYPDVELIVEEIRRGPLYDEKDGSELEVFCAVLSKQLKTSLGVIYGKKENLERDIEALWNYVWELTQEQIAKKLAI